MIIGPTIESVKSKVLNEIKGNLQFFNTTRNTKNKSNSD